MPPNCHFVSAVGSVNATEMAQLQRIAPACLPRRKWRCAAAVAAEKIV